MRRELIESYYEEYQRELERFLESDPEMFSCKLRLNGTPVPLLRNGYSIFNGTKYR